jgi:hypothetical protein
LLVSGVIPYLIFFASFIFRSLVANNRVNSSFLSIYDFFFHFFSQIVITLIFKPLSRCHSSAFASRFLLWVTVAYQSRDILQELGNARNSIEKLNDAVDHTVESIYVKAQNWELQMELLKMATNIMSQDHCVS